MKTPMQFYEEWTPEGLARRKNKDETRKEIEYIVKATNIKRRILDVGCGYGRLAIPLAKMGYKVDGMDIAPSYIKKAIKLARQEKLYIGFKEGDMRKLPYTNDSYDAIICWWGAFVEITKKKDQLAVVSEMYRVLKKEGFSLIDMPIEKKEAFVKTETKGDEIKIDSKTRIVTGKISGLEIAPLYNHNEGTLSDLMIENNITDYKVFVDKLAGKNRQFLKFWKR